MPPRRANANANTENKSSKLSATAAVTVASLRLAKPAAHVLMTRLANAAQNLIMRAQYVMLTLDTTADKEAGISWDLAVDSKAGATPADGLAPHQSLASVTAAQQNGAAASTGA